MSSIIELIDGFHLNKISAQDYLAGLDKHMQFASRKLSELERQKIVPEDQQRWNEVLLPGLQAAYEGMLGAAAEAKEYAKARDEEVLKAVGVLLAGVDQVMLILEEQSGGVSASTLQVLQEVGNVHQDGVALENRPVKGSAESAVSFLD